jgi:hypothetical protein
MANSPKSKPMSKSISFQPKMIPVSLVHKYIHQMNILTTNVKKKKIDNPFVYFHDPGAPMMPTLIRKGKD